MNNDYIFAEKVVTECERRGINLCSNFQDWTKTAMALADLGEDGRSLFHRLASMDEKYKQTENDKKFSDALRTTKRIHLATLFYHAEQSGVSLAQLRKQHCFHVQTPSYLRTCTKTHTRPQGPQPMAFVPFDLVTRSEGVETAFTRYLRTLFPDNVVSATLQAYHVGSTKRGATIFPQIDEQGRCHNGLVMFYHENGHRYKKEEWEIDKSKKPTSLHRLWHPDVDAPCQCLFGEHLLRERPDAQVGLVEAEKSAIICAMALPDLVWVATCGSGGLSKDKLKPLQSRQVIAFADLDAVEDWRNKLAEMPFSGFKLSGWHNSTQLHGKADIADEIVFRINNAKHAYVVPKEAIALFGNNPHIIHLCETLKLEVEES
ncbi:MAG: DUF6371 domain-containing protein [Prevotella sp.]